LLHHKRLYDYMVILTLLTLLLTTWQNIFCYSRHQVQKSSSYHILAFERQIFYLLQNDFTTSQLHNFRRYLFHNIGSSILYPTMSLLMIRGRKTALLLNQNATRISNRSTIASSSNSSQPHFSHVSLIQRSRTSMTRHGQRQGRSQYPPWRNKDAELTACRLELHQSHVDRTTISMDQLRHSVEGATEWIWNQVKIPKGFENFFPKNGAGGKKIPKKPSSKSSSKKANEGKATASASKNTSKKSSSSSSSSSSTPFGKLGSKQSKKGSAGGGGSGGPEGGDPSTQLGSLTALAIFALVVRALLDDESNNGGREITWSDFRNYMLESNDVDRIVVSNKKVARVYLRPGAPGVPNHNPSYASSMSLRSSPSSRKSADGSGSWGEETVLDLGATDRFDLDHRTNSSPGGGLGGGGGGSMSHNPAARQSLVYHFTIGSVESFEDKLTSAQKELNMNPRDFVPVQYVTETNWATELFKAAPMLIMVGLGAMFLRGMANGAMGGGGGGGMGGVFKIGKSNAKKIKKEDVTTTFKDVAGCQEAKKEIMEFVDFLQDNTRFTKLGAKIPKGALLCGPPGTGKTLLARAVAGEANVPFYTISGSDFIEMFVGVGPSRVRDLFKEARANAPCIVFIDEIDAVGRQRGRGGMSGGNDERENTLNQLLVEMDGFNSSQGVVVLGGTNRVDILDQALTRPGRFDRQIMVDKPDLQGRKEIFMVHLQGITLESEPEDVAGRLAGLTPGFAGADIANICNEAAIQAARRKGDSVTFSDFEKATDRIIGGLESNKIMSKEERSIVAHHEAGHAVAGWFLEHADPLLKVTIIPRSSGALGYAQYLPKEVQLRTQNQIMDIVCMALAGRAAEEIFFGNVTTGASDDLRRVTDLVYQTIQVYGMNERVGQLAFPKDPNAMPGDKPYSDATAQAMDEEARIIVDEAYQRTLELLREKKPELEKVANMLLEKETITHDDIYDTIGARPFEGDAQYNEYVSKRRNTTKETEVNVDTDIEDGSAEVVLTPGLV